MRIHHWGWEPLWLFALAVDQCGWRVVRRWNSQWNSAQQGGMTAQQVQGRRGDHIVSPQTPLPCSGAMQWRNWGEIPGVNPTYFHTLWTLCGHRPRFWARGQGTGLQPNCYHSFFTNWSGPPSYKYTHKSIFWHISNCSLVSLNLSLYLYPFPNSCEKRTGRIVTKTKQNFVMTRIYILNIWSWIFNIHAHKL